MIQRFRDFVVGLVAAHLSSYVVAQTTKNTANMLGADYEKLEYTLNTYFDTMCALDLRLQKLEVTLQVLGKTI